jgi:UTP--glucose-1-phosphate uridylyltransferase
MTRTLVILAAGHGTRLLPITSVVAKELLPLIDTPVIEYILDEALVPGIERVVLVTNRQKTSLVEYLLHNGSRALRERLASVSLEIVYQEDHTTDYGTGAGVLAAAASLQHEPFLLLFGDSFSLRDGGRIEQMIRLFETRKHAVASVIPIAPERVSSYGIVTTAADENGDLTMTDMVEKPSTAPTPTPLAMPGAFLLTPDIFPYIRTVARDAKGEVPFTNALLDYARDHGTLCHIYAGHMFETGNRADMAAAILHLSLHRDDTREHTKRLINDIQKTLRCTE